ncbi:MAG TPA: hydroxymethylbilane synthase [Thermoanaerobaculia bacterium]|nr:hydroxymethylbilane synthase [Thermoanaerobaculia bacterium]
MTAATLRLGTRRSALAMAQSAMVAGALEAAHPGLAVELVPIVTEGDRRPGDLSRIGGKGLFTRELEERLLDGGLDLAVHSLKDLPVGFSEQLLLAAFPRRADPRDALISETATSLSQLPEGAVLLTGSLRRQAQLRAARPDLRVEPVRGNVETRVRKWRQSGAAGLILAAAGLARLGIDDLPAHPIEPRLMLPAPGQGTLALQVRRGTPAETLCRALDHPATALATRAERAVVAAFGADCTLPLAAWAEAADDGAIRLAALLATPDGRRVARAAATGRDPEAVAGECTAELHRQGAAEILAQRSQP